MAQKPKCGAFFECENQEKHPEAFFVYHCGNCMACIDLKNPKSLSRQAAENPEDLYNKLTFSLDSIVSDNKRRLCNSAKPCYGKSGSILCTIKNPCGFPY